jgi:hypothetical protein
MKRIGFTLLAFLAATLGAPCLASKEHAPLNPKVIAAKTVYVENHGSARLKDKAYDELKKWGRWEIVEDRTKAEVVIVLSSEEGESSTGRTQTYDPNMKTGTMTTGGWKYGTQTSNTSGSAHMELLDPKTGESFYADTRGTVHTIIKELQKRMEQESKQKKN